MRAVARGLGRSAQDWPVSNGVVAIHRVLFGRVHANGRCGAELLGPGDLVQPPAPDPSYASVPYAVDWQLLERSLVTLLDRLRRRVWLASPRSVPSSYRARSARPNARAFARDGSSPAHRGARPHAALAPGGPRCIGRERRAVQRDDPDRHQPDPGADPQDLRERATQRRLMPDPEPRAGGVIRRPVRADHARRHILPAVPLDRARGFFNRGARI